MKSLNLGILAHVDAGKTSLTERFLFESGVIPTLGSVDTGNTQTDSMALERQRGITIRSAVVSFTIGKLKINLIDTPGHPDFIAEVERALSVLDAVVLVVSAVEGVQPQTRILMRALRKLNIPTLIFINKIDRRGARGEGLVSDVRSMLFPHVAVMSEIHDLGDRNARVTTLKSDKTELIAQVNRMEVCPIFYGSALTGAGVPELMQAIERLLSPQKGGSEVPLSGVVFKIERGQRDEKIAYVRVYAGTLTGRSRVEIIPEDPATNGNVSTAKITGIQSFSEGKVSSVATASAGDIVKVFGLRDVSVGDWLGVKTKGALTQFARPSLEIVIAAKETDDRSKLFSALTRMSEQDPLIQIRQSESGVLSIRLYGEVQREVIQTLLLDEYNLDVEFEKIQAICIEKVRGLGTAFADRHDPDNYFEATIGLRVAPGKPDSGVVFDIGIGRGSLPVAFQKAIADTVHATLKQGLYGWEVTDCFIEVTQAGYDSVTSDGGDFRKLTPLLLMEALQKAGTDVCEPLNRFELDAPEGVLPQVVRSLSKAESTFDQAPIVQEGMSRITGTMPARKTFDFERTVPNLTHGEGAFIAEFGGCQPVRGTLPIKARVGPDPLNRQEYLGSVMRRG